MTVLATTNGYRKAQIFLGLLVFGAVFAAGPVQAQSDRDTANRLRRIENEIETLGRAVYKGETPPPGSLSGGTSSADTEVRIQQFEAEIRSLTGKIEEQDYQIRQLREQLERLTTDIEMRLGDKTGDSSSGGVYNAAPIQNGSVDQSGGIQYQDRSPPQPAPAENTGSGYQWNSGANTQDSGQLGTYSEGNSGGSNDAAAALYESAFALLKGAQYDEAEKEFVSFLDQYPGHVLTGNAMYWLGETYYVRGQFEKAAQTFAQGYQKDQKGGKAADNLLKMGMALSGMGKKPEACVALGQIEKEFASAGPVLRRAQQEMTRLGC